MATKHPPLDELVWQSSEAAAFIGQGWGVHNNNVLYYFAESPFFDRTSNNQIVRTQAEMGRAHMIATRDAFEGELRKRSGLEFIVSSSQIDYGHSDVAQSQGRWVINKQRRTKRPGGPDQVEVLAVYYVLGDLVYMAPSVDNILWNRLHALTEQMRSLVDTATKLPHFTPAYGYQYIDPSIKRLDTVRGSSGSSALPSRAGSPTPAPAGQEDVLMGNSQETADTSRSAAASVATSAADTQALLESFSTFQRYRHEYMDDVPLVGEPGSFSFANRLPPKPQARPPPAAASKSATDSRGATQSQPTQPATQDSAKSSEASKTSKDEKSAGSSFPAKLKRRKSKAPTSPSSPTSPMTPSSPLSTAPSPMA